MSDLQIALLLIGAVIVAAVLIFNWNQERRFKKQAAAAFQSPTRDALLERPVVTREAAERIEPGLREPLIGAADLADNDDDAHEPSMGNNPAPFASAVHAHTPSVSTIASMTPSRSASAPAPLIPAALYDELIEYRVRIVGDGILAAAFADDINRTRGAGKPVRWLGLPVDGNAWEEVQPWREVHYQEVQAAMQLADRNGAVQEDDLNTLCAALQDTAQKLGLKAMCDDVADALQRAQSIDHFCVDVDVLIGLNVVARGEGTVQLAKVLKEAEGSGMVLGVDGVYQLIDSRGESLYSLCNHDAEPFSHENGQHDSQGVTLQFDVPRVPDGLKVFDGMVGFGRKLANEVGGLLVDDNMRPLTDSGIDKIRQQLAGIYQRMDARGIPSGSRRALRLFS
ncbi:MAG: cell division protein ZipA C-terminal FtsZ-binding domain-containing protein [Thiobacillaceae bacterium]